MTTILKHVLFVVAVIALPCADTALGDDAIDVSQLEAELRDTESAFAATMSSRDLEAFAGFLADEVVFFSGDEELRGKQAVLDGWAPYFDGAAAFSWRPEAVVVLESGSLGYSTGPVHDPDGTRIGTFNSVWRRTTGGRWEIIFDRGCPPCGDDQ